jgi:hypothetical protein
VTPSPTGNVQDVVLFMRRHGAQPQLSVPARTARARRSLLRDLCDRIVADPAADHSLSARARHAAERSASDPSVPLVRFWYSRPVHP